MLELLLSHREVCLSEQRSGFLSIMSHAAFCSGFVSEHEHLMDILIVMHIFHYQKEESNTKDVVAIIKLKTDSFTRSIISETLSPTAKQPSTPLLTSMH